MSCFSKNWQQIIRTHIFHRCKNESPKITYDSMPQNIEIKKLRETWLKSRNLSGIG